MIVLDTEYNIRQFQVYLKVIEKMYNYGEYSEEEIRQSIFELEKEIAVFCHQKRDVSAEAFRHLITLSKFPSADSQLKGSEILINPQICNSAIKDLFDDAQFEMSRITEIAKLVDTLVKYNIEYAEINRTEDIERHIMDNYFLSTRVPENIADLAELWRWRSKHIKACWNSIYKTYSDQEIIYTKFTEQQRYKGAFEDNEAYHYLARFNELPKWVINGSVEIYRDGSIYWGASSPHTHFTFRSTTLYPNLDEFPTYDELYSVKQVKSLKKI